ncbi:MAG: GNAT family N-acetyltransferase [Chloroflexi bacterium]|nr:GNAT family N-acetyltransferase [Anaerolineaceae bacterium]NMB88887.1 GNAT family N-acetyltransferase [Chloroflexota bacterium]
MSTEWIVRLARPGDIPRLAELCGQLGYPSETAQVQQRFDLIAASTQQAILVVEHSRDGVVGWAHVLRQCFLESDPFAELGGLVVSERHRRTGVGRALMAGVEEWCAQQGIESIRLRSNTIRHAAHRFYQQMGFTVEKTQYTFVKRLGPAGEKP